MAELRDAWSKIDIVLKALAGVALPIALFWIGHQFSVQQENATVSNRQAERLSSLLAPLASENPTERRIAIEVAAYWAMRDQLPPELVPIITNIAKEDPSATTAQAAAVALLQIEKSDPGLRSAIEGDIESAPARIYFHISVETQREAARTLAARLLETLGPEFVVPGVEKKPGPTANELRFFKKSEKEEADKIAQALSTLGVRVRVQDLSKKYEASKGIRPRHYELWLAESHSEPEL